MKKYRNTFGPPHVTNKWLTLENILQGIPLGLFVYEDLPDEVRKDIDTYINKQKNKQKTLV